jgi:hypothetical protein
MDNCCCDIFTWSTVPLAATPVAIAAAAVAMAAMELIAKLMNSMRVMREVFGII